MTPDTIFTPLEMLYETMDDTWNKVALQYGFVCNGCEDNCCKSLFFHHTAIEKAYLLEGFNQLDKKSRQLIHEKAQDWYQQTFEDVETVESRKLFCPVNRDGQCTLYKFRPMICRLHGLPHELNIPGRERITGPGCNAGQFEEKSHIPFDRTGFYKEMAQLESEYQKTHAGTGRIKQTIAQMILTPGNLHPPQNEQKDLN